MRKVEVTFKIISVIIKRISHLRVSLSYQIYSNVLITPRLGLDFEFGQKDVTRTRRRSNTNDGDIKFVRVIR